MISELRLLTEKVADFITGQPASGASEGRFESLALEVFDFQYRNIDLYREHCRRVNRGPSNVRRWGDIPAMPALLFKHFFLYAGQLNDVAKTFCSSGTSAPRRYSQAHFSTPGMRLMDLSIEANAAQRLFPEDKLTRILVLAPGPAQAPASIMSYGMARIIKRFGVERSRFLVGANGLNLEEVISELRECQNAETPVSLLGSSFGFVHLFDALAERELTFSLSQGSQLMHAGGYKGRSREISPNDFIAMAHSRLGIPPRRVINLLGMTELASQIYDCTSDRPDSDPSRSDSLRPARRKIPPAWMRTRVVDPRALLNGEPAPAARPGQPGVLWHLDLANVERPMAVQTEDLGVLLPGGEKGAEHSAEAGFEILGRAEGAEMRGCSLSLEEFFKTR
ncbi:MAG TPA: hypothetical protein VNH22_17000 [Blastocatellia bacterium]|nr:hypothetical protein [Blastocatellia bacterium]